MTARWSFPLAVALLGAMTVSTQVFLLRELVAALGGNETAMGYMLAAWLAWTAAGSAWPLRVKAENAERRRFWTALTWSGVGAMAALAAARASRLLIGAMPGEVVGPGKILAGSIAATGLFCVVSGYTFAAGVRAWGGRKALPHAYLFEGVGACVGGIAASFILLPAMLLVYPPGFRLVDARNSRYGALLTLEREGMRVVYENGAVLFQSPDPQAAEESVHYALLEHPAPRRVLLIGGGLNGAALEAAKHPSIERIDYVELDPELFAIGKACFPEQWRAMSRDARIHMYAADGRRFVKTVKESYDAILVNTPPPTTAMLNRFYTLEFFREARARLTPAGVLALRLPGAENFISEKLAQPLRSIRATLRAVFPAVLAMPGENIQFFAASDGRAMTLSADELIRRLRLRGVATVYVREHFLPFRLAPDRIAYLEERLGHGPGAEVNRDFRPIAYHLETEAWGAQFGKWQRGLSVASLALAILLAAAGIRLKPPAQCIAATGFTTLALEVMLLLGFQAIYGYVYQRMALLIATYMAGMAAGAWMGLRGGEKRALAAIQAGMMAAGPLLFGLLAVLSQKSPTAAPFFLGALAVGFLGGYQFPVASRVYEGGGERRPSALYAIDLAGACAGALLVSSTFIPLWGFAATALALAAINALPLTMAVRACRGH